MGKPPSVSNAEGKFSCRFGREDVYGNDRDGMSGWI
jgi:hypothetical protein